MNTNCVNALRPAAASQASDDGLEIGRIDHIPLWYSLINLRPNPLDQTSRVILAGQIPRHATHIRLNLRQLKQGCCSDQTGVHDITRVTEVRHHTTTLHDPLPPTSNIR